MSLSTDWFKDWVNSSYYHLLYARQDEKDAAFIPRLLHLLEPAAGSFMLDSACGKGSRSRLLASMGYDVTGIDLSFYAIDEAGQFESERLHFFQHDLRLPFWMNYFHFAFCFTGGFGLYKSKREHANAIRTIAHSLKPGGRFVLDYLNVRYAEQHVAPDTDVVIDEVHFNITEWHDDTYFFKKIMVQDGQSDRTVTYQEKQAKFSLGDIQEMFSIHHIQVQHVFGDYDLNEYDAGNSPRLIVIGRKMSDE